MQKILRKRVLRDLKENFIRYLALGLLIVLGMYIVVSMVAAADTVITQTEKMAEQHHVEDGQFRVAMPLSQEEEQVIADEVIKLERMFFIDVAADNESTLRMYQNREQINRIALDEGRLAKDDCEVVLEKRYAAEWNLKVGDTIHAAGVDYEITGIGSVPDYEAPFKEFSDSAADSRKFGLAFVTAESYEGLKESGRITQAENCYYAYRLGGSMTDEQLKTTLMKWKNDEAAQYPGMDIRKVMMFLTAEDNPRISAAGDDQVINRMCGLIAGVIIMILFTYVISVFVIHGIERESSIIGALYALGVKKGICYAII